MKLEFSRQIFENTRIKKFHDNPSSGNLSMKTGGSYEKLALEDKPFSFLLDCDRRIQHTLFTTTESDFFKKKFLQ